MSKGPVLERGLALRFTLSSKATYEGAVEETSIESYSFAGEIAGKRERR